MTLKRNITFAFYLYYNKKKFRKNFAKGIDTCGGFGI